MEISTDFDAVVIGNVGIDTNVYLPGSEIDFSIEANFTKNLDYIGQAGGFTSKGFAHLGYKTAFIGYIGDDFSGNFIRDEFRSEGIDTSAIFIDPAGTSRSINFMYPDGRRKNFYDGKSHMDLIPELEICEHVLKNSKLAHFHIPNWARFLLPLAKKNKVIISCDLQDIITVNDPYRRKFIEFADVLFFSAVNHPDPTLILHEFLKIKPELICISGMGAEGCALGYDGEVEIFPPIDLPVPVIDTNGAGDSLAVGFLSSHFFEGFSLKESVLRGQIAARYACSLKASSSNLITKGQLDQYFHSMTN